MPRGGSRPNTGGARPGAGRPPGRKVPPPPDVEAGAINMGMTPLDYMLAVMRDPTADTLRRDKMAQAAAPFVHPRAVDPNVGKKEQAEYAAKTAEIGTSWEALLN